MQDIYILMQAGILPSKQVRYGFRTFKYVSKEDAQNFHQTHVTEEGRLAYSPVEMALLVATNKRYQEEKAKRRADEDAKLKAEVT